MKAAWLCCAAAACTITNSVRPASLPGMFDGQQVTVELRTGARVAARGDWSDGGAFGWRSRERFLDVGEVRAVEKVERGSGALEGLLLGLTIGVTAGALIGWGSGDDRQCDLCATPSPEAAATVTATGLGVAGALVGLVVGAAKGHTERYELRF